MSQGERNRVQRLMEAIENCIDLDTAARLSSELETAEAAVERRLQSNRERIRAQREQSRTAVQRAAAGSPADLDRATLALSSASRKAQNQKRKREEETLRLALLRDKENLTEDEQAELQAILNRRGKDRERHKRPRLESAPRVVFEEVSTNAAMRCPSVGPSRLAGFAVGPDVAAPSASGVGPGPGDLPLQHNFWSSSSPVPSSAATPTPALRPEPLQPSSSSGFAIPRPSQRLQFGLSHVPSSPPLSTPPSSDPFTQQPRPPAPLRLVPVDRNAAVPVPVMAEPYNQPDLSSTPARSDDLPPPDQRRGLVVRIPLHQQGREDSSRPATPEAPEPASSPMQSISPRPAQRKSSVFFSMLISARPALDAAGPPPRYNTRGAARRNAPPAFAPPPRPRPRAHVEDAVCHAAVSHKLTSDRRGGGRTCHGRASWSSTCSWLLRCLSQRRPSALQGCHRRYPSQRQALRELWRSVVQGRTQDDAQPVSLPCLPLLS